jgi:hypothetical protein
MAAEPVPFIEQNLMSGERLVVSTRNHSATVTAPAAFLALPALILVIGLVMRQNGVAVAVLGGLLLTFLALAVVVLMIERATTGSPRGGRACGPAAGCVGCRPMKLTGPVQNAPRSCYTAVGTKPSAKTGRSPPGSCLCPG